MYELRVVTRFAAAHQLTMVGSKCENMHGHNWKIEVYVTGDKLNAGGVLVDFGEIKAKLAEVMKKLDHKYLNELEYVNGDIWANVYGKKHILQIDSQNGREKGILDLSALFPEF